MKYTSAVQRCNLAGSTANTIQPCVVEEGREYVPVKMHSLCMWFVVGPESLFIDAPQHFTSGLTLT